MFVCNSVPTWQKTKKNWCSEIYSTLLRLKAVFTFQEVVHVGQVTTEPKQGQLLRGQTIRSQFFTFHKIWLYFTNTVKPRKWYKIIKQSTLSFFLTTGYSRTTWIFGTIWSFSTDSLCRNSSATVATRFSAAPLGSAAKITREKSSKCYCIRVRIEGAIFYCAECLKEVWISTYCMFIGSERW
jgi:hypothetical protein